MMSALRQEATRRALLLGASIAAAAVVVYVNSLTVPFVYDDDQYIVYNERLHSLWPIWKATLGTARPVVYLSWAMNYAIGQLNPVGYHIVNLVIHGLAGLTLFGIVRRTLQTAALRRRYGAVSTPLGWASALLWTVHPLTSESVTFVYQRAESLMALFYLLTLYTAIRGAASRRATRWYTTSIVCCALGMASKAIMVTAPLMIWLYDRMFLAGSFRQAWRLRRGLYAGLLATWALLAWLLVAASKEYSTSAGLGFKDVSSWQYLCTQPGVLMHYLRLAVWPHPLTFDYYGWPVARTASAILPPLTIIGSLLGLTVFAVRRGRPLGFLGAWFFGILAPTSSVIPIADLIVEHRMYLPLMGLVVLAVTIGYRLFQRWTLAGPRHLRRLAAGGALAVTTLLLASGTIHRNTVYQSPMSLWQDVIAQRPDNARAHYAIGTLLGDQGQLDQAIEYFRKAYRLQPRYFQSHYNMAVALSRQQRYAEAFIRFEELIRLRPRDALIRYAYGLSLAHADRLELAIVQFRQALDISPDYADLHYNLAIALLLTGERLTAARHFARTIVLQQQNQAARDGIAQVVAQVGLTDDVIHQIKGMRGDMPALPK